MRRTRWAAGVGAGLLALLAVPAAALADGGTLDLANAGKLPIEVGINSVWVLVAGILVMFMQAGFAFLEIGFSRGKNAGTVIAKILVNFSIARDLLLRGRLRLRVRRGQRDHRHARLLPGRRRRGRELPAGQRRRRARSRSRRCGSSSSSSAPSRWRSSGARRSSASSSASTSSTRSSSRRSSTRSARTGSSAAAGSPRSSACRTSPARRWST